nr:MAG TPA: hypothetical protein [Caudoviricetes sp.]
MFHLVKKYLQYHVLGHMSIIDHTSNCHYLPLTTLHILDL